MKNLKTAIWNWFTKCNTNEITQQEWMQYLSSKRPTATDGIKKALELKYGTKL